MRTWPICYQKWPNYHRHPQWTRTPLNRTLQTVHLCRPRPIPITTNGRRSMQLPQYFCRTLTNWPRCFTVAARARQGQLWADCRRRTDSILAANVSKFFKAVMPVVAMNAWKETRLTMVALQSWLKDLARKILNMRPVVRPWFNRNHKSGVCDAPIDCYCTCRNKMI